LAQYLGVKEFAISKYKEQASSFGQRTLKSIFDSCVQTEGLTKTGKMEAKNALYYLLGTILK